MVSTSLPSNVHLLTLEEWTDDTVLIRVEHQFEVGEDPTLSQKVKIQLKVRNVMDSVHTFWVEQRKIC